MNHVIRHNINFAGFSLLELLVTVAILGILASMSFALFDKYKQQAYATQMISVFSDIQVAGEALMIELEKLPSSSGGANEMQITRRSSSNNIVGNYGSPSSFSRLADSTLGHILKNGQIGFTLSIMYGGSTPSDRGYSWETFTCHDQVPSRVFGYYNNRRKAEFSYVSAALRSIYCRAHPDDSFYSG